MSVEHAWAIAKGSAKGTRQGRTYLADLLASRTFARKPWYDSREPGARDVWINTHVRIKVPPTTAVRWREAYTVLYIDQSVAVVDAQGRELLLTGEESDALAALWGRL